MNMTDLTNDYKSPGGEIGRRSRLKICRSQECAGSIPVPGTMTAVALAKTIFLI
jgi:hypothetical protein